MVPCGPECWPAPFTTVATVSIAILLAMCIVVTTFGNLLVLVSFVVERQIRQGSLNIWTWKSNIALGKPQWFYFGDRRSCNGLNSLLLAVRTSSLLWVLARIFSQILAQEIAKSQNLLMKWDQSPCCYRRSSTDLIISFFHNFWCQKWDQWHKICEKTPIYIYIYFLRLDEK